MVSTHGFNGCRTAAIVKTGDSGRENCSVQHLQNILNFEDRNTEVNFGRKKNVASTAKCCLTVLPQCWRSKCVPLGKSSLFSGSETQLSNGGLAGDDLGCNDANSSKHGETAIVQLKIAHIRVVSQVCTTRLKRVAEIPDLFVWIMLPKYQLEST